MEIRMQSILSIIIFINIYIYRNLSTDPFLNNGLRVTNLIIFITLLYIHRDKILENPKPLIIFLGLAVLGFGPLVLYHFNIIKDFDTLGTILIGWVALVVSYALYGCMKNNGFF